MHTSAVLQCARGDFSTSTKKRNERVGVYWCQTDDPAIVLQSHTHTHTHTNEIFSITSVWVARMGARRPLGSIRRPDRRSLRAVHARSRRLLTRPISHSTRSSPSPVRHCGASCLAVSCISMFAVGGHRHDRPDRGSGVARWQPHRASQ